MGRFYIYIGLFGDFPGSSAGKESACNAGDHGSTPGSGRSPGEGIGNSLQYSCLENPVDRGAWQATVHGVTKSFLFKVLLKFWNLHFPQKLITMGSRNVRQA